MRTKPTVSDIQKLIWINPTSHIYPWCDHFETPENLNINLEGASYQQYNLNLNGWIKLTQ